MMKTHLGKKVKNLRDGLHLSLTELSEGSGLSRNHIWEVERGKADNPTIETLCSLAKALRVNAEDLCFAAIRDHNMPLSIAASDRLRTIAADR